jgi:mono/diheme cytochrome c family protein
LFLASGLLSAQTSGQVSTERAIVDKYCVTCHNSKTKVGGLSLDKLDLANVPHDAETWEKVISKLRTGAMPPLGMPRPDKAAYNQFATYLETSIDKAAALHPNPGRPALHRLNRAEYANAIRDLLALNIEPTDYLPADDASYGFDNVANVLGLSPALQERYISAAAKISRLAVGDPATAPIVATYRERSDISQNEHLEGLPLGTRGGIVIQHNFPLDGEYVFKVKMLKSTVDLLFGGSAPDETLEIAVNGERLKTLTINPAKKPVAGAGEKVKEGGFDAAGATKLSMSQPPDTLEVRVPVKAGPQTVTAAFLQRSYGPVEDLSEPLERSTFDPSDPRGLPHVLSVSIAGPFNATGSGDTPSRRKIFLCHPSTSAVSAQAERSVVRASEDDLPCAKKIISTLARHAWREPVSETDIETLLGFYQQGRNKGTFENGIELALRRILASPQFLFRFERDPATVAPDSNYRVGDIELASRLSFFLWSSIPDDELIDLARQNKLHTPTVLEGEVRRMLADPKSQAMVDNFAGQWLYLRNLRGVAPDLEEFPNFDDNLRQAFKKETELFFGSIMHEDHNVLDLLNANYTYVNDRLARHYGIPNIDGSQFRRVTVTDDNRRGLLGQGSILTVTSVATRTSPVQRGKWLLENILGTPPNPPPANVPPLKENSAGAAQQTVRERMELHRRVEPCAGCHKVLDPLGFALDNFDGVGAWRVRGEDGAPIDASGVMSDGTKVSGVADLRNYLMSRPNVFVGTMTTKLMTYALGRGVEYYDMPAIRAIVDDAARNDYRFSSLVLGVMKSAPFQMRRSQPKEGSE